MPKEKPWGGGQIYLVRIVTDLTVDEAAKLIEETLRERRLLLEVEVTGVWE